MDIALDTNIFVSNFLMNKTEVEILFDYLKKTDSSFILPDVVIKEVKNKYEVALRQRIDKYLKSANHINMCFVDTHKHIPEIKIDTEKESEEYISYLRRRLDICDERVLPYNNDYLPELINRAINKFMPFKKEDKGFRDTIIWLSLKDYCVNTRDKQIAFISNNPTDFASSKENSKLHPRLEKECEELGIKINYFKSITDFISNHSEKIDSINEEWLWTKLDEFSIEDTILEKLNSNYSSWTDNLIDDFVDINIVSSYDFLSANPINIGEISVYELMDNTLMVNVEIESEIETDFEIVEYYGPYRERIIRNEVRLLCHTGSFLLTVKDDKITEIHLENWD